MRVVDVVDRFFSRTVELEDGDSLLVAFSGGPDSTALTWGLQRWASSRDVQLLAAHLDHGADAGSAERALRAERLARRLGVSLITQRRSMADARRPGESPEEVARRVRYEFLEQTRRRLGCRFIVTAHHADDQVETVLLRMLQGSGPEGLAGIRTVLGPVVRPLLDLTRRDLAAAVQAAGLESVDDPTNRNLDLARNRVRHQLLPHLVEGDPDLFDRLISVSRRARDLRSRLETLFSRRLGCQETPDGASLDLESFIHLPKALQPAALTWLHRRADVPYPPSSRAMDELFRQVAAAGDSGTEVGCDCGGGWRWQGRGSRLVLRRAPAPEDPNHAPDFTYTLEVPGEIVVEEISSRFRLVPGSIEPWMFRSSARRAGLALALEPGACVEIRNRRPGDRLRPLGAPGRRRLKEVLIDRRIPRERRDHLPLLVVDGAIAWVPGVTLGERFRLREGSPVWTAEILPLPTDPLGIKRTSDPLGHRVETTETQRKNSP